MNLRLPSAFVALLVVLSSAIALAPGADARTTRAWTVRLPPWVKGEDASPARIGWLPVGLAPPPGSTPESWMPAGALERLAAELTRSFAASGVPEPWIALGPARAEGAPFAVVSCVREEGALAECDERRRETELSVTGPSKSWRASALALMNEHGLDALLVPSVALSETWLRQANLRGSKEIVLGTGHSRRVPWLTSLETPVEMVQVSVVLVDREGKVARSSVEGLLAVRTGLPASAAGLQKVVSPGDIDEVTDGLRREDLPGAPRVTDAAVRTLLAQVLGPGRAAPREP